MATEAILNDCSEFLLVNEAFHDACEKFTEANCKGFEGATVDGEQVGCILAI